MKYERLTTDKTQSNKDFLLNFAFVKDCEVEAEARLKELQGE